jgi:hypothetical protein
VSKCTTLTRLFSLQDICWSYDQCPGSSAKRNYPLALLFPVSITMIILYALHPTQEWRRAPDIFLFLSVCCVRLCVSVSVCVFLNVLWVSGKTNGENKEQRKCSSRLMNPAEQRLSRPYYHTEWIACSRSYILQRGCIFCHFLTGTKLVFFLSIKINIVTLTCILLSNREV